MEKKYLEDILMIMEKEKNLQEQLIEISDKIADNIKDINIHKLIKNIKYQKKSIKEMKELEIKKNNLMKKLKMDPQNIKFNNLIKNIDNLKMKNRFLETKKQLLDSIEKFLNKNKENKKLLDVHIIPKNFSLEKTNQILENLNEKKK